MERILGFIELTGVYRASLDSYWVYGVSRPCVVKAFGLGYVSISG